MPDIDAPINDPAVNVGVWITGWALTGLRVMITTKGSLDVFVSGQGGIFAGSYPSINVNLPNNNINITGHMIAIHNLYSRLKKNPHKINPAIHV